jgi:Protein kinase domain
MSSSATFESELNNKIAEILINFDPTIRGENDMQCYLKNVGNEFYDFSKQLGQTYSSNNVLTRAFEIIEKNPISQNINVLNLVYFLDGMNELESYPSDFPDKINSLIQKITDEYSADSNVPIPQSILSTFEGENYTLRFLKTKEIVTNYLIRETKRHKIFKDVKDVKLDDVSKLDYEHQKKLLSYCRTFWLETTYATIYNRIVRYQKLIDETFPLEAYSAFMFSIDGAIHFKASDSIFYSLQDFEVNQNKCETGKREIGWKVGGFLGAGEYGDVYEACCRRECKTYALKIARHDSYKDLKKEIEFQKIASNVVLPSGQTLKFAPDIVYAGIRKGNIQNLSTSIIVMERVGHSWRSLLENFWDADNNHTTFSIQDLFTVYNKIIYRLLDLYRRTNIIHSDSHPGNIMFVSDDEKVFDDKDTFVLAVNNDTCKVMFIDYGLATTRDDLKNLNANDLRYGMLNERKIWLGCSRHKYTTPDEWQEFLLYYSFVMTFSTNYLDLPKRTQLFQMNLSNFSQKLTKCRDFIIKDDPEPSGWYCIIL